jgi:para-nitrobenzyl esterase
MTAMLVTTPLGDIVAEHEDGVVRARGIPYAATPLGAARFAPPRRRAPFRRPFDARREGATPQRGTPYPVTVIPEPSVPGDDILQLSITAPAEAVGAGAALPVLFWIHGGGYVAGSPASPWYDGAALARAGLVSVRPAYRLGIEGFGVVEGDSNRGLSDLLCALDWVRECVGAFGGDPAQITVAGQSAGGGAVLALLASPGSAGRFARAVCLSGVDISLDEQSVAELTEGVAARLGVAASADGFSRCDPFQVQSALLAEQATLGEQVRRAVGPVHGTALLPAPIHEALGVHGTGVPLLIGATADEFDSPGFAAMSGGPAPQQQPEGSRVTDLLFRSVVPRTARARVQGAGTWLYSFDWPSPVLRGAGHCADLPFWFDALDAPGVTEVLGANPPTELARAMSGQLAAFVRGEEPSWPPARGEIGDATRVFSADGTATVVEGRYDVVLPSRGR